MARLRRSHCSGKGIERRRSGRGFTYRTATGERIDDPAILDRIRQLAIPPAWVDVWICPWPNGHIQAMGTDAAGRRQYLYHDDWRVHRDRQKFDRVLGFARSLPDLREVVARDLGAEGLGRERVLAGAVRLLDVGCFRIGGEAYAEEHETFGIATLLKEHVTVHDGSMVFDYPAKGSIRRVVTVSDPEAAQVVSALKRRRSGGPNLFAYRDGRRWAQLRSDDVNAYIKAAAGEEHSAKDFRTWSATVLAAASLAEPGTVPASAAARRRAVTAAVVTVARQLGNTPAVCRSSYIDPRVIDRFEAGETIGPALVASGAPVALEALAARPVVEEAVLALLG